MPLASAQDNYDWLVESEDVCESEGQSHNRSM